MFSLLALFIVFYQTSKRKRIKQRPVLANAVHRQPSMVARIRLEPRFRSWFKIFPWEGAGILVMMPGTTALGETNSQL
jgi:hypothetical protein